MSANRPRGLSTLLNRPQFGAWARGAGLLLCVALTCFFWRTAHTAARELERQTWAFIHCEENAPTAKDYDEMLRAEQRGESIVPFALWTQLDRQNVTTQLTRRTVSVSVLLARGDSRLVLPVSPVLAPGDSTGCLMDADTADTLFGNQNAVGEIITYKDMRYTVRGVFEAPAATILLQAAAVDETPLPNITLEQGEEADTFILRHQLSAGRTVRVSSFAAAAQLLSSLPMLACMLMGLGFLLTLLRQNRAYPVRCAVLSILLLTAATGLLLWLFTLLPSQWTPSRWSDFSFWSSAFSAWRKSFADYFTAPKYRPELLALKEVACSAAGCLSVVFLLPVRKMLRSSKQ